MAPAAPSSSSSPLPIMSMDSTTHGLQLLEVHVFFRHGDRSPTPLGEAKAQSELWASRIQEVPAPLKNREYFPQKFPWGLLTTKGAEQARDFGVWLREHYLPEFKKSNEQLNVREAPEKFVNVRVTTFLRTNLTAWFMLEELLESSEAAATIPFACRPEKDENLYHNEYCPRLRLKWDQAWATTKQAVGDDGLTWREHFKDMEDAMARHLNLVVGSVLMLSLDGAGFPWITAVDTFNCGRFHGDPLPDGVTPENIAAVRRLLANDYAESFQDRDVLQLSIGRLVRELKEALLDRVNAPPSSARPSLFLYSGHDVTIMPLSVAFGVPWPEWPGYMSSISVELWRSAESNEHFVRLLFDRKEVAVPVSRAAGAPRKPLLSIDEFCTIAEYSCLQETEFSTMCQDVSDIDV